MFPQNFTQLGKILQDCRSQGPDKYQVCDNEDHEWVDDENDGIGDDWVMMKMPGKRC